MNGIPSSTDAHTRDTHTRDWRGNCSYTLPVTTPHPHCRAPRKPRPEHGRIRGRQPGKSETPSEEEGEKPTSSASASAQRQTVSVLVVEDHPGVRESAVSLLRQSGYRVSAAADGVEALGLLRAENFDVLILDLRLPRMNGPELLDALDTPPRVIVASALEYFNEEDMRRRFGSKIFAFLQKPIPPALLLAAVADAIRDSQAPQ